MAAHSDFADLLDNIKKQLPPLAQKAARGALRQQRGSNWGGKVGWLMMTRFILPRVMQQRQQSHRLQRRQHQQPREAGLPPILALVIGMLGGAALMYLFDPDRGVHRRAALREQATRVAADVSESVQETTERVRDEVSRVVSEAEGSIEQEADQVRSAVGEAKSSTVELALDALVRAEVARNVSSPDAVVVAVDDGVVSLSGIILASEAQALLEKIQALPGAVSIQNHLEIRDALES